MADPEDDGADPEPGSVNTGGRHQIHGVDHQAKVKELLSSIREPMLSAMNSVPRADMGDNEDDGADPDADPPDDKGDNRVEVGSTEGRRRVERGSPEGDPEGQSRDTGGQEEADPPAGEMSAKEKADQYFKRRREKAKQQDNQLEQTVQDLRRRIDDLTKPQAAPAAVKEDPKPTDPQTNPHNKADDPVAYFEWEMDRTKEELARTRKANEEAAAAAAAEKQALEQAQQQKSVIDNYAAHVDSFLNPAIQEIPGFGKMIDRVVEGLAWTAMAQGAKSEEEAVRQATMTMLLIAQKAEQARPNDPDAITKAVYDYCEKVTGGVHMFQDDGAPATQNGNGQQPDLAGARAAAKRRAPGSINSRPGGKGGATPNTIQGLGKLRDREMSPVQAKSIFAMMRKEAGLGR